MKKALPILLALALLLSLCSVLPISAEGTTATVYISDSGSDANDGLTAGTPVKGWARAGAVLSATGAADYRVVIVGISTYLNGDNTTCPYWMMGLSSMAACKPTVVTGSDPSAIFRLERTSVAMRYVSLTFDGLQFIGDRSKVAGANDGTVVYTDTVTSLVSAYISDAGNDSNDGLSAASPKKTYSAALTLLDSTAPAMNLIIPSGETFTYTDQYWFMNRAAGSTKIVIRGESSDATFRNTRNGSALRCNVTFANLRYVSSVLLNANGYTLEFSDSVVCLPTAGDATDRTQFPILNGGLKGGNSTGGNLILNGGTFNYVYAGSDTATAATTGTQTVTLGKNATILHTLHVAQKSIENVVLNLRGTIGVALRFSYNVNTVFDGDVLVNVGATAAIGKIMGAEELSSGLAAGKTATFDFSHSADLDNRFGTALDALDGVSVVSYDRAPVLVGAQVNASAIRFCATLDEIGYASVGFTVEVDYTEQETAMRATFDTASEGVCKTVYEKLSGIADGETVTYDPADENAAYFFAIVINGLPADLGDATFRVTPYAVSGGETLYGASATFAVTVAGGVISVNG